MEGSYKLVEYEKFKETLKKKKKTSGEFKRQVEKIKDQLKINPYVGKPI